VSDPCIYPSSLKGEPLAHGDGPPKLTSQFSLGISLYFASHTLRWSRGKTQGGKPDDITVVVARVTALSPTNVGAFQTATQDAQAAAMEVQQVAEKAIAFNAVKPGLPKLPGGTIKVRKQK
jgi:hypothetical protein